MKVVVVSLSWLGALGSTSCKRTQKRNDKIKGYVHAFVWIFIRGKFNESFRLENVISCVCFLFSFSV
jgi:hypothetical protein